MSRILKIGVIGCGAIGTQVCKAVDKGTMDMELYAVYDRREEHISRLKAQLVNTDPKVLEIDEMVKHVDLVVECATQKAVEEVIPVALEAGLDVLILSVGAFASEELFNLVMRLAKKNNCKVYLPSGAVAGLDGLKSGASAEIYSVTLTTTKPPKGLEGAPYIVDNKIDLGKIDSKTIIFEGTAQEAVKAFPANVNVAATISLAGIGFDKTKVRIVANPELERNTHEITVEGEFGKLTTRVENVPSPANPKTSYLAALSAIATLKKISDPIQVGT